MDAQLDRRECWSCVEEMIRQKFEQNKEMATPVGSVHRSGLPTLGWRCALPLCLEEVPSHTALNTRLRDLAPDAAGAAHPAGQDRAVCSGGGRATPPKYLAEALLKPNPFSTNLAT